MTADLEHDHAEAVKKAEAEGVIRLRGLPFKCQPEDVKKFFHPTELAEVYFCRRDGACSRDCQHAGEGTT
jgi:hypothetical protein